VQSVVLAQQQVVQATSSMAKELSVLSLDLPGARACSYVRYVEFDRLLRENNELKATVTSSDNRVSQLEQRLAAQQEINMSMAEALRSTMELLKEVRTRLSRLEQMHS
jgi:hypothetical protein